MIRLADLQTSPPHQSPLTPKHQPSTPRYRFNPEAAVNRAHRAHELADTLSGLSPEFRRGFEAVRRIVGNGTAGLRLGAGGFFM